MSKYTEVVERILKANNIIVVSHAGPDPDAYSSSLGMTIGLRSLGKNVECYNENGILESLDFLPYIDNIKSELPTEKPDLLIVCDCAHLSRTGDSFKEKLEGIPSINIDHHYFSNGNFGEVNLVEEFASSTAEIVAGLLVELKVEMEPELASLLTLGIYTDTMSLQKGVVTENTYKTLAMLKENGADLNKYSDKLFWSNSIEVVRTKGYVMSNVEPKFDGKYVEVILDEETVKRFNVDPKDCYGLKSMGLGIDGVMLTSFLRYENKVWKLSLRSKSPVDVNIVAQTLGGGGHKGAAAAKWKGELKELLEKLNIEVQNELKRCELLS